MSEYLLKNATILDGTMDAKPYVGDIYIKDDKIADIGPNLNYNGKKIDLTGKYIIPGLINLHVHLPGSGKAGKNPATQKKLVKLIVDHKLFNFIGVSMEKKYAQIELKSGVTTLRSVGGVGYFDTIVRDKINQGKFIGPRILAANYAICPVDGHMQGTVSKVANTPEEAVKMVEDLHNSGVDLIKLMITGGVLDAKALGEPGVLKMDSSIVKAACDKAHEYGLKVAAHVESYEGTKVALENGVDTIEHGSEMDDELIKLYKDHNAAMICTLSPAIFDGAMSTKISGASHFDRYNTAIIAKRILNGSRTAIKENIPLGLGNDVGCPRVFHYDFWRELEYFAITLKMDRLQALSYGTLQNAKIIGLDKEIGSIEKGKIADLVVASQDPTVSFTALKTPMMVIHNGSIVKDIKIDKDLESDAILDKIYEYNPEEEMDKYFEDYKRKNPEK